MPGQPPEVRLRCVNSSVRSREIWWRKVGEQVNGVIKEASLTRHPNPGFARFG